MDKVAMKQRPQSVQRKCMSISQKERVPSSHHKREQIAILYLFPFSQILSRYGAFSPVSFFFLDATAILGKLHSLKLSESMQVLDAYITYLTELVRDFFKRAKPHRFSNYPWYDLQTE